MKSDYGWVLNSDSSELRCEIITVAEETVSSANLGIRFLRRAGSKLAAGINQTCVTNTHSPFTSSYFLVCMFVFPAPSWWSTNHLPQKHKSAEVKLLPFGWSLHPITELMTRNGSFFLQRREASIPTTATQPSFFSIWAEGFRRKLGLHGGRRPSSLTSMRRCLWKTFWTFASCSLAALFSTVSAILFCCLTAFQLPQLSATPVFAVIFLKFQWGFFWGGWPLFTPVRHFCVPTMNLFSASVPVIHPSGCNR